MVDRETALIVGVGSGLSASLARLFHNEGMAVALAARNADKLDGLAGEIGGSAHSCDASDPASAAALFENGHRRHRRARHRRLQPVLQGARADCRPRIRNRCAG